MSTHALDRERLRQGPRQLGTLGGGNHFLELDRDPDGFLWLLVHTGSRGIGATIASHHARSFGPPLAGLPADSPKGRALLADHDWTQAFARHNRTTITERALEALSDTLGTRAEPTTTIDGSHNGICRQAWQGKMVFVHRKGAVAVPPGSLALVPGSMATASYVVEGVDNEESFGSCSHGAGRVMTRAEARQRISPQALAATMRRIAWPAQLAAHLVEEAPGAYRDIKQVLDDQRDLVRRRIRLEPLAVLKG